MPTLETYRKQAKRLVRWHRQANYSVGEKLRVLPRYRHVTDREALDMAMPLTLAQEIVAVQAGFADWGALKAAAAGTAPRITADDGAPDLIGAIPILFVRNVADAARFYGEKLGFIVDFLHGNPPFYGAVSRDGACLHLRLVHRPNFADLAGHETSLILVTIETRNVKALFEAFSAQDIDFAQRLVTQPWGGTDFHVRDPDGNVISFVQYRMPQDAAHLAP